MERVELAKAVRYLDLGPGMWTPTPSDVSWVRCGGCGERVRLTDHTVASDGAVTPSLVCPVECGWHVQARLVGWEA